MDHPYYVGKQRFLLNLALGLGTFIQILDTSIANVAIPYISGNLSVSTDEGTWVITSFAASNAIVLPLTGWLSDYFGRVHLFVYSLILFSLASFLCGFSSSLEMLVIFRVFQGAVAGSLIPLSQSLLIMTSPPEKQGFTLGLWAMIVVVAPVLGPILGGYITEEFSWPWIFYINVPIGLFSSFVTWNLLKNQETKLIRDPIDWIGLTLLSIAVGCLQIMLDKGNTLDWFSSPFICTLAIISAVTFIYFIGWNLYAKYPIVDFTFFKDRNYSLGTLIITIGFLLFFCSTVILPLWLQTVQSYTPFWAGVAVAPIGIFPILFSALVGANLHRFDIRYIVSLSFLLFALSFFYQANFTSEVSLGAVMFTRLLQGLGLTIFFIPLVQLSLGNISKDRYASASGVFNFIRILVGSGFGTSLAITLWNRLEIFHHTRLGEAIVLSRPEIVQLYQSLEMAQLGVPIINRVVDQSVTQQAYMLSTNDVSWMAGVIYLLIMPIPLFCKRVKPTLKVSNQAAH